MAFKLITIGTDVAALFLFHPDDLTHRQHHPIAWYSYDFWSDAERVTALLALLPSP